MSRKSINCPRCNNDIPITGFYGYDEEVYFWCIFCGRHMHEKALYITDNGRRGDERI